MLFADAKALDAAMDAAEASARAKAADRGKAGVCARVCLRCMRTLMKAIVEEMERHADPNALVDGLLPLFANALSSIINTNSSPAKAKAVLRDFAADLVREAEARLSAPRDSKSVLRVPLVPGGRA